MSGTEMSYTPPPQLTHGNPTRTCSGYSFSLQRHYRDQAEEGVTRNTSGASIDAPRSWSLEKFTNTPPNKAT